MTNKKIIIAGVIGVLVIAASALTVTMPVLHSNVGQMPFSGLEKQEGIAPSFRMHSDSNFKSPPLNAGVAKNNFLVENNSESFDSAQSAGEIKTSFADKDKKIIKNGYLAARVNNADQAVGIFAKIAQDNGGELFSSEISSDPKNNIKFGAATIRVPVNNFKKVLGEIKKTATLITHESVSSQDVTEEYLDIQTRLKNKQAEERQFATILEQAQKIQDVLDVTRELSRVRGEIEQLQGRIKYLDSLTDMASIVINFSEDQNIIISDSWRPWQIVKEAFNNLIEKAQDFINFIIILVITIIPVIILYGLLAFIAYWLGRKIYRKFKKSSISGGQ